MLSENFWNDIHWSTFQEVYKAIQEGAIIENWEECDCGGWDCSNDPNCHGHVQVFLLSEDRSKSRVCTLSDEDIDAFIAFYNTNREKFNADKLKKRIRQVRDSLNKCKDPQLVEVCAHFFGL